MARRPFAVLLLAGAFPLGAQAPAALDSYDLVWRGPSADASGSIPIGNGEVGCNVWVEPGGRLCCLVSRTDSFSEACRLLKLGKLVLSVPWQEPDDPVEQRLCLREGCLRVTFGAGERRVSLKLFVDSDADVIHIAGECSKPAQVVLAGSTWRMNERRLEGEELQSSWTMQAAPPPIAVTESADLGLGPPADLGGRRFGFYHRNATSVVPLTLRHQGLAAAMDAVRDPLLHRAFGLVLAGTDAGPGSMRELREPVLLSPRGTSFAFQIAAPCVQDADEQAFARRAAGLLAAADPAAAAARTATWWQAFWARSFVFAHGDPEPAAAAVPANDQPLRIGVDSRGGNRFAGRIEQVAVYPLTETGLPRARPSSWSPRALELSPAVELRPGDALPVELPEHRALDLSRGFWLQATIAQAEDAPVGRIVDKITAGGDDGFLFDTHPGRSLRLVVGGQQLAARNVLEPGKVHEVGAVCDAAAGRLLLLCDGKVVAESRAPDPAPPSRLTQALVLQRWVQACGGRGAYPIKFNGSIFTVEPRHTGGPDFDADWRRWGDCYWWQNTRLPYHPMLAQGDFDMMEPLFRMYEAALPLAEQRTRIWHSVQGAWFPETMNLFGAHANRDYGWDRQGLQPGDVQCMWWRHAWNQGPELLALMLDRQAYAPDRAFARDRLLPMADAVLAWFDTRFPRDGEGRLRLRPTQAVETYWHSVENDMPAVAGLHDVLARLLLLPADLVSGERRQRWQHLRSILPPVPLQQADGAAVLAPAERYEDKRTNVENPELYAIWPFRLYGLGRPGLEVGRASFARRHEKRAIGWTQDGQQAALLGLLEQAKQNLLAKVQNGNRRHRFPAMWGPNFDWLPDQCHGGNLLLTAQCMLLQPVGDELLVLPCWPLDWDVRFRLHAPGATVVEVDYRGGKVERLSVEPPARLTAVVLPRELAAEAQRLGVPTFAR